MTTTKLLCGAAVAALLSGGALAQDNFTAATGDLRTDRQFAAEYDGAIGAEAIFTHDSDNSDYDALGGAAVVDVIITLTGGLTLAEIADNADFTNGGVVNPAGVDACAMTIQSGGGIGSTSVTYRSTGAFRDCDGDNLFRLDLLRGAAAASQDSGATVQVICNSDCGAFVNETDSFTLIDDTSAFPAASRNIVAGGAVTLATDGIGPVGPHALGDVNYEFNGTGIFTDTDGAAIPLPPGGVAAIAVTDAVASANVVVDFPLGRTGVAGVTVSGAGACAADAAPANSFTCPLTPAQLGALVGGANGLVAFTSDVTNPIAQQTPTVAVNVTSIADYNVPSGPSGNLNAIEWDDGLGLHNVGGGGTNDDFEWVRFGSGGTESNFRIQLDSEAAAQRVTEVHVAINDGNGVAAPTAPAYFAIPAGAVGVGFQQRGATITFNSGALSAAAGGATGNADITAVDLVYTEGNPATSLGDSEIRRQLVNRSPGSFVATPGLPTDNN